MPKKITQKEFIEKLKKRYDEEKYDFSQVIYKNAETNVKIICNEHGVFYKKANSLVRKAGNCCPKCSYDNLRSNKNDILKKIKRVHENKYTYNNLNYTQWHNKINITCKKHGDFKQTLSNHLKGSGCPICHKESTYITFDLFVEKANKVHKNRYDYSKAKLDFKNTKEKVIITCRKHGDFKQSPHHHVNTKQNCPVCTANKATSKQEKEIVEFIKSLKEDIIIKQNSRSIIAPNELDVYLPEYKLAIEYSGIYWHTEGNGKKDRNYHLNKTKLCYESDITLLQIFGNEWNNSKKIWKSIIANRINKINTIYARKCQIKEVDNKTSKLFLDNNHLQGSVGASYKIGLFYNNELVSLMTFGKSRFNKNVDWELVRFASKLNNRIIGGASKLFKHFLKVNSAPSIISYADKRFSNGNLYKILGFTKSKDSPPNYFYTNDYKKLWSRVKYQKHKLKSILEVFDPNLTEWENMQKNKWDRIWDCGNKVYIYNK